VKPAPRAVRRTAHRPLAVISARLVAGVGEQDGAERTEFDVALAGQRDRQIPAHRVGIAAAVARALDVTGLGLLSELRRRAW
jgi:hypothetical protein